MNYRIAQAEPANRPAHPELVPIIRKTLMGIWALPDQGIFMSFEDGHIIKACLAPGIAGFQHGLRLTVGTTKPGTDWHAQLDPILGTPPGPFSELIGLPFRGLDIDVFQFGPAFGLKLNHRGILLLREAPKQ